MRAALLSVGSEILRGDIVDTNAAFLARQLTQLGFEVRRVEQVGDELQALTGAVTSALEAADVVIATGGLGPTEDDRTRHAVAAAVGEEMYHDDALVAQIEERFAAMGRRMAERNRQQALLIPSAEPIPNSNGTAPGWYVRKHGRTVAALPGPPAEMQPMWNHWLQPRLEALLPNDVAMVALMTFGIGESALEERIDDLLHWHAAVTIATYAKTNGVQVHVTARGRTREDAAELATETERRLRERLGVSVFGTGDDTLSAAVGRILRRRCLTLAVMESVTGGELSSLITNTEGSSAYFLGGCVAYTAAVKLANGVDPDTVRDHGLISPETALSMAAAARSRFGSDIGLGLTGIAGTEPVEGKSPGTCYIGLSMSGTEETRKIQRPGQRELVKRFAAQSGLDLLRRELERSR